MHWKFYLDTMSIQMLHKQSTDTQLCPHPHQGWAPRTPHAQSEQTPEHTELLSSLNASSITAYIYFLMR